jgi:hypothetical protein
MPWPQATDYNAAVQAPPNCFLDADLRAGRTEGDLLGLPRPYAGAYADVYQFCCPDGCCWAAKCFKAERPGLRARYLAISQHLQASPLAFMVPFQYLDPGIRIKNAWFPLLKMRWVEGLTLNTFLAE